MTAGAPRIGLVVPCRDEEAVVGRKLANLARCAWPARAPGAPPHRVVVVDDHSTDRTRDVALEVGLPRGDVELALVSSRVRPGKAGALAEGIEAAGEVDILVLSDADVVLREDALAALAAAFEDPRVAMASGAQEVVRDLADDGTCRAAGGGAPVPAAGLYDRWTAAVRRLESRAGLLFSVHGQLLAWRASLGLRPAPGVAADDLELMLQARARGGRVVLVPGARFLEARTPAGPGRDAQEMRRARAYFQLVRRPPPPLRRALDRAQWRLYRHLPGAAPLAAGAGALAAVPLAWWGIGPAAGVAAAAGLGALAASSPGRRLARLLATIERARREERRGTVGDRWEMRRT